METENQILTDAAELLKIREAAEATLRNIDYELREVIKKYSTHARLWGMDRHKLRIVCEYRGYLPKYGAAA
jgi:hypothetical protein